MSQYKAYVTPSPTIYHHNIFYQWRLISQVFYSRVNLRFHCIVRPSWYNLRTMRRTYFHCVMPCTLNLVLNVLLTRCQEKGETPSNTISQHVIFWLGRPLLLRTVRGFSGTGSMCGFLYNQSAGYLLSGASPFTPDS